MIYKSFFSKRNKDERKAKAKKEMEKSIRNILMSNPIWFSEKLYGQENYVCGIHTQRMGHLSTRGENDRDKHTHTHTRAESERA